MKSFKGAVYLSFAILTFVCSSISGGAAVVLDQEFVTNRRLVHASQPYQGHCVGMQFTASQSGQLMRIEVDLEADHGLRTDLQCVLMGDGRKVFLTLPYWKIPIWFPHSYAGIDVSALNFQVTAGASYTIAFMSDLP